MRLVTNKELSTFRILPFDLYNESNMKILSAGEVLTAGKLIMLKNHPKIYTEDFSNEAINDSQDVSNDNNRTKLMNFSYEMMDISDFETVINTDCVVKQEEQIRVKYYYKKILDLFNQHYYKEGLEKLYPLVRVITSNIYMRVQRSQKGSEIRFMGEYEICHPLNVGILSGLIAKKLEYNLTDVEHIILAGILHDIGKFQITLEDKSALLTNNEEEVKEHTTIGYGIIKNELNLPENIALVALEHHENNDGSGYPQGLSSDYITEMSQIINVANYYDNLACNRTIFHVTCNRDVLRTMLEVGTKRFSAKILYTFIHMFNYDDAKEFDKMID